MTDTRIRSLMRLASHPFQQRVTEDVTFELAKVVRSHDGSFVGVVLNGERSEHGNGIRDIRAAFGVRGLIGPEVIGVDARQTRARPHQLHLQYHEGGWSRLSFTDEGMASAFLAAFPENPESGQIYGAWNHGSFCLLSFEDEEGILNRLMLAFEKKAVLLSLAGKEGAFGYTKFALTLEKSLSDADRRSYKRRDELALEKLDAARQIMAEEHGANVLRTHALGAPHPMRALAPPPPEGDAER